jgi:hypothetical protein
VRGKRAAPHRPAALVTAAANVLPIVIEGFASLQLGERQRHECRSPRAIFPELGNEAATSAALAAARAWSMTIDRTSLIIEKFDGTIRKPAPLAKSRQGIFFVDSGSDS